MYLKVKHGYNYTSIIAETDNAKMDLDDFKSTDESLCNKAFEIFEFAYNDICCTGTSTEMFKEKILNYFKNDILEKIKNSEYEG